MSPNQPVVVSVIVPVYNAGAFLRRTLDCICGQTLRDIELILVDDGSTDTTPAILQEYAARDSRITLLQQEHEYAGAARNKGMDIARGKYFSFLDADDIFEPTMLEKMVKRAEEVAAEVVVCRCDIFHTEGEYTPLTWQIHDRYLTKLNRKKFSLKNEYPQAAFQTFIGWAWDKLFSADYVKENGFRFGPTRHGNDAPFVFPAIAAARCISIIDEALVKYRKYAGQISDATNVSRNETACCTCINLIHHELERLYAPEGVWQSFYVWTAHYVNWNMNKLPEQGREKLRACVLSDLEAQYHLSSHLSAIPACELTTAYERDIHLFLSMLHAPAEWCRALKPHKRVPFPLSLFYKTSPTKTSFCFLGVPLWSETRKCAYITHRVLGLRISSRKADNSTTSFSHEPLVSVIVPVRNAQKCVRACLRTLQKQTETKLEFIFVDDASTDDTSRIICRAAAKDSRIILLQQKKQQGPGVARNRGIVAARGKYIGFIDADDSICPEFYEQLLKKADDNNYWVVKGTCTKVCYGIEKKSSLNDRIRKGLKEGGHLLNLFNYEHWTAIYQRDFINRIGARNGACFQGEDNIFLMQVMCNLPTDRFTTEDAAVYYYQVNEGSISANYDADFLEQSYRSLCQRLEYMATQPDSTVTQEFIAEQFEEKIYHRVVRVWDSLWLTKPELREYMDKCVELMISWLDAHPNKNLGEYSSMAIFSDNGFDKLMAAISADSVTHGKLQMAEDDLAQLRTDLLLLLKEKQINLKYQKYRLLAYVLSNKKHHYQIKKFKQQALLRRIQYLKMRTENVIS